MATGLLGKKLGMTQVYDSKGRMIPVTVIQAGPCYVLQVKTAAVPGRQPSTASRYLSVGRRPGVKVLRSHV